MANPSKLPSDVVSRLRELAHDLSNSLETIMQASYLLGQSKLEPHGKRWVEVIEEAAQDAAHINRQLREVLREEARN
jgi:signal transduction histidine kinase